MSVFRPINRVASPRFAAVMRVLCPECRGIMRGYNHEEASAPRNFQPRLLSYCLIDLSRKKQRADERTRTADLLITSVRSVVAGACTGLRIPHRQQVFCSLPCPLLQGIACGLGS